MTEEQQRILDLEAQLTELRHDKSQLTKELMEMERLDRRLLFRHGSQAETVEDLLDVIDRHLDGARTAAALPGKVQDLLEVTAHRGLPPEAIGVELSTVNGPVAQTIRSGSPRAFPVRRLKLEGRFAEEADSVAVVPLMGTVTQLSDTVSRLPKGVILVLPPEGQQFRGTDLEFLRRVGVHGGVLLENARLLGSLQRSEEMYRTIVDRANLGMALLKPDGTIRHTNEVMRKLGRITAPTNQLFSDYVCLADRWFFEEALRSQYPGAMGPTPTSVIRFHNDLEETPVKISLNPIRDQRDALDGYIVIARDVSQDLEVEHERKAMERRIQQAEKMSAVGNFVAGIAHELNNPLTVVVGYSELLAEQADLPTRVQASVREILTHAKRCGRIVADLLTFARQERKQPETLSLGSVVEEAIEATKNRKSADVSIEVFGQADVPTLLGSPHALCQVVTNILNNAFDAVGLVSAPGRVKITLAADAVNQTITIEDNGPGFKDPDRVFDPFYTTKPIGKGTGLGLSICYGIIRDHEGEVFAENVEGGGARLVIMLPQVTAPIMNETIEMPALSAEQMGTTALSVVPETQPSRLLVVDDEPGILDLISMALEAQHTILTAETVEAALRILEVDEVDLVLTDLRLPDGMTGPDFYEEISKRWPALCSHVAFMTGDTVGEGTRAFLDRVSRPCLQKPFKVKQLQAFVRAQLDPS